MSALSLRTDTGKVSSASGKVETFDRGARLGKAIAFAVGGVVGAVLCLPLVGVHLITTWLLPVLGLWFAWTAWSTEAKVSEVRGQCPACGKEIVLEGGALKSSACQDSCPSCQRPLEIRA